jgi:hypothetical protein
MQAVLWLYSFFLNTLHGSAYLIIGLLLILTHVMVEYHLERINIRSAVLLATV